MHYSCRTSDLDGLTCYPHGSQKSILRMNEREPGGPGTVVVECFWQLLQSSVSVLYTNIVLAIVANSKYKQSSRKRSSAEVSLYEGDCAHVKTLYNVYHVIINIMSTLLLGAWYLCMQLLAAPTRAEVDKTHNKGQWLDIGVLSWRNLRHIDWKGQAVWWCLGVSSIPLHFM